MHISPRASVALIASIAVAVLVGGIVAGHAESPPPTLPALTAEQLLTKVIDAGESAPAPPSFSGEATSSVNLGLPQIAAGLGGGTTPAIMDLLTSDQTYRVWQSPDGVRVANTLRVGERDLVANQTDAWLWDSTTQTARHLIYDGAAMQAAVQAQRDAAPPDPATLATAVVRRLAPYADLSVTSTQWVAGEPSYTLVLTPSSPTTSVGSIQVALDANNWMPLQLEVFAKGADAPSISVGFTSIAFGAVDPSTFDFTPPAGATVTTTTLPSGRHDMERSNVSHAQPRTIGTGFDTVIAYPLAAPLPNEAAAFLPYAGPLVSAIVVDRGGSTWVLAGAVSVDELNAAAARLP
jgi:outer membrane lipoprotein-sorting protein